GKQVAASARNIARAIYKSEFWSLATSLLSDLETDLPADKLYKKYLERYLHSYSLWAPFMRVHAPFNTTMVSESFHSKLKMSVLEDNTLSRVDRLAHLLLALPAEVSEELRIADRKKYVGGVFRLQAQMAAHKKGVAYGEKEPVIDRPDKSTWIVESSKKDGTKYKVTDYGQDYCTCDRKNLHCMRCGVCPRRYRCNCQEGNRSGTNCKHCHWAILSSNHDPDPADLQDARIEVGEAVDLEHNYDAMPPLQPIEDDIPAQFQADDIDEEEREMREREKEEEDRRNDEKMKYRGLMLEALNRVTAGVRRCMREDDDATRLKEAYEGILMVMEGLGIDKDQGAVRGERPKKRQGEKGASLLDRETRGEIKRKRRAAMGRPAAFPVRNPEENIVCVQCKRAEPIPLPCKEEDDINWVACNNEDCGLYYHEICCQIDTVCMCGNGVMIYKEIDD
ncbi:hypothetical protein PMAYCL1PPCAC_04332, partial [Pristionchus mayeri]